MATFEILPNLMAFCETPPVGQTLASLNWTYLWSKAYALQWDFETQKRRTVQNPNSRMPEPRMAVDSISIALQPIMNPISAMAEFHPGKLTKDGSFDRVRPASIGSITNLEPVKATLVGSLNLKKARRSELFSQPQQ